jgi:hypothetical protein
MKASMRLMQSCGLADWEGKGREEGRAGVLSMGMGMGMGV